MHCILTMLLEGRLVPTKLILPTMQLIGTVITHRWNGTSCRWTWHMRRRTYTILNQWVRCRLCPLNNTDVVCERISETRRLWESMLFLLPKLPH